MRAIISLSRCLSLLSIPTLLVPVFAGELRAQTAGTDIDYTGSLMGYYRMEATEQTPVLQPVSKFLGYRNYPQKSGNLLLGMGDNFGPEFGASLQLENPKGSVCYQEENHPKDHESKPESLYKNDDRVALHAECDNVLNFLMHAGFRAVVPGYQDFMYTARWLRGAARLLAEESSTQNGSAQIMSSDGQLYMLAANLRISMKGKVTQTDKAGANRTYSVNGRCPLLFSASPLAEDSERCVGDTPQAEPLDWLDRLDRLNRGNGVNDTTQALQQLATESSVEAAGRSSELNSLVRDEVSILHSAWGARVDLSSLPASPATGEKKGGSQDLTAQQAQDMAEKLNVLPACTAADKTDDVKDMCTYASRLAEILTSLSTAMANPSAAKGKITGASYLLTPPERVAAINGLLRTIADEQKNIGYTVAQLPNGHKALIVGVVGETTMKAVSETNLRLCINRPKNGKWPSDFGSCGDRVTSDSEQNGLAANVLITDPIAVTEALVRAAGLEYGPFDSVVVMAQMPRTEAEVLAQRVWSRLKGVNASQHVDVILSEADPGYGTPNLTLQYPAAANATHPAPVLTPVNSYSSQDGSYPGTVSRLTIQSAPGQTYSLANQPAGIFAPPSVSGSVTTISLLYNLMAQLQNPPAAPPATAVNSEEAEFALLKELQQSTSPQADVVMLQSRDVETDKIGQDYTDYKMCDDETVNANLCKLRVALDRIFWKGDFLEFVAVQGKDLKTLLDASEQMMAEQAQLSDNSVTREWLVSYGVVQSTLTNITEISRNSEPLWIPVDPTCAAGSGAQSTYCVEGTPIVDDAYYWLLTTDQMAQDKAVYGTLEKIPEANHESTGRYVTAALSHHMLKQLTSPGAAAELATQPAGSVEKTVTRENELFQQSRLWQVDFSKLIASFTARDPVGGNQFVGDYFQGASNSQASAPNQQELDLELASRISGNFLGRLSDGKTVMPISVGMQTTFLYDRAVLGNLTPATKSINATYALNSFNVGPFLQMRLPSRHSADAAEPVRSLPRNLLVLSPRQYQIQINNQYLFFPFAASSPLPGELTAKLARNDAWTDRAGFRREFGENSPKSFFQSGNFVEAGMEMSVQSNVLSALTLKTGSNQKTCQVSAIITLQTCFSQAPALVINNSTTMVGLPGVKTLHTPGLYWQLHLQNKVFTAKGKQVNLVTDSVADYYFGRPPAAELPTQTEYAIPLSLSLVFPAFGNLSFAPTYSVFFYQPQLSSQTLQVNSISIAARWYFARDARVPIPKQIRLNGPASSDQTKTGKAH